MSDFAAAPRLRHDPSVIFIRMEAIGGQGANLAGRLLAQAAVDTHGYRAQHFSTFGSEKRGSSVCSCVRFSPTNQKCETASEIQTPDLLVLFHDRLLYFHSSL
jgi:pyruvate ferredoxin oxidoreductase gamma subunit